jgi:group I intron endonuclease
MYGAIYKASNLINGKVYIGQTTTSLKERIYKHIWRAFNRDENIPLYNAIRKYGEENFNWCLIDQAYSQDELDDKEVFWIDFLNTHISFQKGYNGTFGGSSFGKGEKHPNYGREVSDETRNKIRESHLKNKKLVGKKKSKEARRKQSESRKGKYTKENNPMYGVKMSEESRKKMSDSRKGNTNAVSRAVIQLNLNGEFVAEHRSIKAGAEAVGGDGANVAKCCRGERKKHKGFKWVFKDDYYE